MAWDVFVANSRPSPGGANAEILTVPVAPGIDNAPGGRAGPTSLWEITSTSFLLPSTGDFRVQNVMAIVDTIVDVERVLVVFSSYSWCPFYTLSYIVRPVVSLSDVTWV